MHGSRSTVIAVLALTLFAAVAHGVATNRWNGGNAAPTIPAVPRQFGAWSAGEAWAAPDYPRLHFMGKPSLYKLYVVAPGGAEAVAGKDAVLDEFLTSLLAVLEKSLFGRRAG